MTAGLAISPRNLSAAEYRQTAKKARRSKYNAMRQIVDGVKFDSKRELKAWEDLKKREGAGEIHSLERQVKYPLHSGTAHETVTVYIADFRYFDNIRGKQIVADAKGCITAMFRLKAKMMKACYGITVEIV